MNILSTNSIIFGFLIVLIIVFGLSCRSFFSEGTEPKSRKIAGQTEIDSEWKEINFKEPLIATSKIQLIGLKLDNVKSWKDVRKEQLLLTNGKTLEIEIELIDGKGNKTKLYPNGIDSLVSFGKRSENREDFETGYFKVNEKFTKLRLRSNEKITAIEITWGEFEF